MDVDPLGVDIGARIRARRLECGMTGKALAAKLSVPSTTVTAWERGRVLPGARSLLLLGRALDTPAATFLVDPDTDPHELAARVSRLPSSALPDLARFLTLLEEAHRGRDISLSATVLHFAAPKQPQDARDQAGISGGRLRVQIQAQEDASDPALPPGKPPKRVAKRPLLLKP